MNKVDSLYHGGSRTTILGLHVLVLERDAYVQFIYLIIYPSIASKGKQEGNRYTKEGKKRNFEGL